MRLCAAIVCLLLGAPAEALAQPPAAPPAVGPIDYNTARLARIVDAVRTAEPITLDGRLNEPAWSRAKPAADFTQRQPRTGAPREPSHRSAVPV
jgi:hypothetical protein